MTEANKTPNMQAIPPSAQLRTYHHVGIPQPAETYDEPPAYSITPLGDPTGSIDHQSRHPQKKFVRLCPHQQLSFERFNQVVNLPNIHRAKRLDALIKLSTPHHVKRQDGERLCFTSPGVYYLASPPAGHISFRYKQDSDVGHAAGFELSAIWAVIASSGKLELRPGFVGRMSKSNIEQVLAKSNVWLCPHLRLSDRWVTSAVFGTICPGERYDDPIEQYQAEQRGGDDTLRCRDCKTEIKVSRRERSDNYEECHVMAVRFLGMGESANDPAWLEQCALPRNEVADEEEKTEKRGSETVVQRRECCIM